MGEPENELKSTSFSYISLSETVELWMRVAISLGLTKSFGLGLSTTQREVTLTTKACFNLLQDRTLEWQRAILAQLDRKQEANFPGFKYIYCLNTYPVVTLTRCRLGAQYESKRK